MAFSSPGEELPPHQPQCFGCGPRNQAGLHITAVMTDEGVRASVRFDDSHEGGPGIAHGGIVAAALDDAMGFLIHHVGRPFVTARLEVDYRRPVPIDADLSLEARVESRQARKVHAAAELRDSTGGVLAEARALFITVRSSHFLDASPASRRRIEELQGEAGQLAP